MGVGLVWFDVLCCCLSLGVELVVVFCVWLLCVLLFLVIFIYFGITLCLVVCCFVC